MIDFKRYKGLLVVGVGLYCALALCNAGLLAGLGDRPSVFEDPDRRLAWSQLEKSGAQVSGVELAMRRGDPDKHTGLGVVLGQSTAMRGIDPDALESAGGLPGRWLLINGFGSSFVKLHYYAQTFLASELRPGVVVLGLHETMLAGQDSETDESLDNDKGLLRRAKQLGTLHWVRKQRKNVSHFAGMELFEFRLALHGAIGSGAVGLFEPADEPWRMSEREQAVADKAAQLAHWQRFGWFDPATYQGDNAQTDAFRSLMSGLEAMGTPEVVIVLMPMSSELRDVLPGEADQRMRSLIDEVGAGRSVRVVDMRDAMPDDAFFDYVHLTPAGREAFTQKLAEALKDGRAG